jgi:hypothetical protein
MGNDMYFVKDMPLGTANLQVRNEQGDILSLHGDDSCGVMNKLGRLDATRWSAAGINYATPTGHINAEGYMHALVAHLGYMAVPNAPFYPFGPTHIVYDLHIEAVTKGRPSTENIVGCLGQYGMHIHEVYSLGLQRDERQLEVFENSIPGPDGAIHIVTMNIQVVPFIGHPFSMDNVAAAVRGMFWEGVEFDVRVRILVDTPLMSKTFGKEATNNG